MHDLCQGWYLPWWLPAARLIKKKREKNQINKIRNGKGEDTTDNAEIHRIIKETLTNNYMAIKKLEEMDRFLEKFNLSSLKQEEIEIMNNPVTSTEIETLIKYLQNKQTNKKPWTRWLHRKILSNI